MTIVILSVFTLGYLAIALEQLSLGILWVVSEMVSHTMDEATRSSTGVSAALRRIDMSSILFFLGILLAVGSLNAMGPLRDAAEWLDEVLPNRDVVAIVIGLVSAVVDNVPLVAGGIEMYDLANRSIQIPALLFICVFLNSSFVP